MKFTMWGNTKDCRPPGNAVWLQEIGWVEGIPATEARPGMFMLYNGGSPSEVIAVEPVGKSSVRITVKAHHDGKEYTSVRRGIIPCQFPK